MKKYSGALRSLFAFLLTLCILFSGIANGVIAQASLVKVYYIEDDFNTALPGDPDSPAMKYELEEYLLAELKKCSTSIDISSYYLKPAEINNIASFIYDNSPELFHVSRLGYSTLFGSILTLNPEYQYTPEVYNEMLEACDDSAEKLLTGIKDNDNLSDVEKALLIHDRVAQLCDYDYANYLTGTLPFEVYSMYGVLVDQLAVCQGYAEAYLYLIRKVGINGYLCESDTLNHAWNIIEIDGEEYHVDVTWDDPVYDVTGRVMHDNFLRSSDGIYATGHEATDYIATPVSTKYDNYFWQNSQSAFQLAGDEIYYIDETDSYIKKYSDKSSVKSVSDIWMVSANSYYPGCFARLSTNGKNLYYNSSQAVFELNPQTGETTEIWRPQSVNAYYRIYGFKYEDFYLICDMNNSPYFNVSTKDNYQQRKLYINPEDVVATSVSINTFPAVSEFDIGENYSSDGLSLLVTYNNGETSVITEGFTLSGADTSTQGEKTVTVTYEGFEVSYTFTVACKHKKVNNISAAASTCISQGHGAYSQCNICKIILSGSDELLPLSDHKWSSLSICETCGIFNDEVIIGDINADNIVNSDDAIHLLYATLLPDRFSVNQPADFDGNSAIDSNDAIYLLYHTLLPERYPLA